ncbi:MAG TPA: PleD family two-component system response regulator [Hyphomicrobiaceae bacterium]|nr:PleD family two-component system response regulator [Hyphomicrobiaceae bacterium]
MTARVLVVDDILANVKLLEARLAAEYFEVLTAYSGQEALDICARERVDVILLDVMMPGMDGFEVCRRLKENPQTHQVPVVMVTALDQPSAKVQGLDSGADDFLTKPVDDIALVTRVKNLARLKMLNDEMLMRASTSRQLGMTDSDALEKALSSRPGRLLAVDDHPRSAARLSEALSKVHDCQTEPDPNQALVKLAEHDFDVLIVSLSLAHADALRLCSQVRSLDRTRHLPIIVLVEPGDEARLLRGLDLGVNDYLMRPIDRHEMLARIRTQIKRKRYNDYLRNRLQESVELAITDSLTGLHNRRYMERHMKTLIGEAIRSGRPLSILLADIDHFKQVNDTYGHDVGDAVLREFADRFRRNTRGIDLACRLGGEEFLIIMPETDLGSAYQAGERLRACVAADPFPVGPGCQIRVTASVGLATLEHPGDTPETVFKRADNALYAAKRGGRNRVAADAA